MKIAVTGHTSGLGQAIYNNFPDSIGLSRSNGYDISIRENYDKIVDQVKQCNVFINCAQTKFHQTELLMHVAHYWKGKIINIGSQAKYSVLTGSGELCDHYSVEKNALNLANDRLFLNGYDSCIINFGDLENLQITQSTDKLPFDYCVNVIKWVLDQPYRIKQLDIEPAWKP